MSSAKDGPGTGCQTTHQDVSRETTGATSVSRETHERLAELLALVRRWNPVVNLVARGDLAALEQRHLSDSLRLLPLLPARLDRAVDLGSGGGFPGLVLAIASGVPFDLVESDQRKAAFLAEAALQLGASARVVARRIEEAQVAPVRLVTARALAPMPRLLGLAAPLLTPDGECLFLKGRDASAEIEAARRDWEFSCDIVGARTAEGGAVLRVGSIARRTCTRPSRSTPR